MKTSQYDVIVIGAGHAGIEAALASARLGSATLLVTMRLDKIGHMSCNPAIGGVGKGQLVKEIDALGGEMAKAADACGIQFRKLNTSKGSAVHSSRAQIDMDKYSLYMQQIVRSQKNLNLLEDEAVEIKISKKQIRGVKTRKQEIKAKAVIIAPGTFLNGIIHLGLRHFSGGRFNEPASKKLAINLKKLGVALNSFKTGTCPRVDKDSIDYSKLKKQPGDNPAQPFSFTTRNLKLKQIPCYITHTNKKTHDIIKQNLDKSPLYSGKIHSTGVRYCPSIEDKIVKFSNRDRHQVFIEPQGLDTDEVYLNGLSTSLPEEVQKKILNSIPVLRKAKILKFGYGIEHCFIDSRQLKPTLEFKGIKNLFFAGQINGTTGYEEAAAQGLIAGINANLKINGEDDFILDRSQAYIGVLIDDLITKGTNEPYRMFTSRVEYRLILREDNADLRLTGLGYKIGLIPEMRMQALKEKQNRIKKELGSLKTFYISSSHKVNNLLKKHKSSSIKKKISAEEFLRRPEISYEILNKIFDSKSRLSRDEIRQVEISVKYEAFIHRQLKEIEKFKDLEKIKIPDTIDFTKIPSLSNEIKEKLKDYKPVSLGQALRIPGVTPAAISMLMVWIRKNYERI